MNSFLIVLFIIIVVLIILGIMYIYFYNKISDTIIRVDEAENRIDNNLRDKYDLLNKCVSLIKGKIELDDKEFKDLLVLKTKKLSNFDLDRSLVKSHNELINTYEENNKDLRDSDELYKSMKQIELIDEELVTLRNYYNANIANYNKMITKFPTLIIARIKKYQERMFYDLKNMKDEDYEDFKL